MKGSEFSIWCMAAGLVAGLAGSATVLTQEKPARAADEMINARRGHASPPSPIGPVEVETRAAGAAGISEAPEGARTR